MKMHIAQSGKHEGQYVECPALIACTISRDTEHMHFASREDAREYDNLVIAQTLGGSFGAGLTSDQESRINEIQANSRKLAKLHSVPVRTIEELEAEIKDLLEEEQLAAHRSMNWSEHDSRGEELYDILRDEIRYLGNRIDEVRSELRNRSAGQSYPVAISQANTENVASILNEEPRREYIASIQSKHFSSSAPGSTFKDDRANSVEDVLRLAAAQRGNLLGDDREKLIAEGADPTGFLPPETGVRYLKVQLDGTESIQHTSELADDAVLTVKSTKSKPGKEPSLSFVRKVEEHPSTNFGTIVVGPDMDKENKPIAGTEVLWTMHPGKPTRGVRSNDVRNAGFDAGDTLTVKELREKFGKEIFVNTEPIGTGE